MTKIAKTEEQVYVFARDSGDQRSYLFALEDTKVVLEEERIPEGRVYRGRSSADMVKECQRAHEHMREILGYTPLGVVRRSFSDTFALMQPYVRGHYPSLHRRMRGGAGLDARPVDPQGLEAAAVTDGILREIRER